MRKLTDFADYFVICSGDSDTHTRAIADNVIEGLNEENEKYLHLEGSVAGQWILIDYANVVVHIFVDETRRYYDLERLWGDADILLGTLPSN